MDKQRTLWQSIFEGLKRGDFLLPAVLASAFEDIGRGFLVNIDLVSAEDPRVGAAGCYIEEHFVQKDIDLRQAAESAAKWWLEKGEYSVQGGRAPLTQRRCTHCLRGGVGI